jgi:hypothetical protein
MAASENLLWTGGRWLSDPTSTINSTALGEFLSYSSATAITLAAALPSGWWVDIRAASGTSVILNWSAPFRYKPSSYARYSQGKYRCFEPIGISIIKPIVT